MGVTRHVDEQKGQIIIIIDGRFDFSQHKAFRDAYRDTPMTKKQFIVDLSHATYLDSSALGMLLLLREYAGGDTSPVRITGCNEDVRRILKIANFERLFVLE